MNLKFEELKLRKELMRSGIEYEFRRIGIDEYGQETDDDESVGILKAIYHEQNGFVTSKVAEETNIRNKKQPMLLCSYRDAADLGLKKDDYVLINGKKFRLVAIVNVQEWGIIGDISLEVETTEEVIC